MKLFKTLDAFAEKHALIFPGQTIIIGLSGGPDSVFLLYYLLSKKEAYNLTLIAAHLNHEWRESAQLDADFCAELCNRLAVPLVSKKISDLAITVKPSGSKEQDARRARQFFFRQVVAAHAADTVALAHHKDDQEETFFIRLFRGTGLTGLIGMQARNKEYMRPLLCITKKEILAWLEEHQIGYVIDPTNTSHDFLRNRIRLSLIPLLQEIDGRFTNSFTNTLDRLQETERFLNSLVERSFNDIAHLDSTLACFVIDKKAFLLLDPVMQYRILIHWLTLEQVSFPVSQAFLDEMLRFLVKIESKAHTIHALWQIIKTKNRFYLSKKIDIS